MFEDRTIEALRSHEDSKDTERRFQVLAADVTQLQEGMDVWKNYEAESLKGKIVQVQSGRHGTGFVNVKWEDGTETIELAAWLRTDPDMVYSHPLFETVAHKREASIFSFLDEEKNAYVNEFGLRVTRCSSGFNVYIGEGVARCKDELMLKQVLSSLPFGIMPEDEKDVIAEILGKKEAALSVFADEDKEEGQKENTIKVYSPVKVKIKRYVGQDLDVNGVVVAVVEGKKEEEGSETKYMVSLPMYGYKVYEFLPGEIVLDKNFKVSEEDKASADKAYVDYKKIVKSAADYDCLSKTMIGLMQKAGVMSKEIQDELKQIKTTAGLVQWAKLNGWTESEIDAARMEARI